jgi:hypothetical protein
MADLPITSDEGAQPVVVTGAVSPYSTLNVATNGSLQTLADNVGTGFNKGMQETLGIGNICTGGNGCLGYGRGGNGGVIASGTTTGCGGGSGNVTMLVPTAITASQTVTIGVGGTSTGGEVGYPGAVIVNYWY